MITKPIDRQELKELIDVWLLPLLGRFGNGTIQYNKRMDNADQITIKDNGNLALYLPMEIYQEYLISKGLKSCTTK